MSYMLTSPPGQVIFLLQGQPLFSVWPRSTCSLSPANHFSCPWPFASFLRVSLLPVKILSIYNSTALSYTHFFFSCCAFNFISLLGLLRRRSWVNGDVHFLFSLLSSVYCIWTAWSYILCDSLIVSDHSVRWQLTISNFFCIFICLASHKPLFFFSWIALSQCVCLSVSPTSVLSFLYLLNPSIHAHVPQRSSCPTHVLHGHSLSLHRASSCPSYPGFEISMDLSLQPHCLMYFIGVKLGFTNMFPQTLECWDLFSPFPPFPGLPLPLSIWLMPAHPPCPS